MIELHDEASRLGFLGGGGLISGLCVACDLKRLQRSLGGQHRIRCRGSQSCQQQESCIFHTGNFSENVEKRSSHFGRCLARTHNIRGNTDGESCPDQTKLEVSGHVGDLALWKAAVRGKLQPLADRVGHLFEQLGHARYPRWWGSRLIVGNRNAIRKERTLSLAVLGQCSASALAILGTLPWATNRCCRFALDICHSGSGPHTTFT